jgi:hypothetical protein
MSLSIISLHDEKHERPLVFPVPSPDDVLPSISDADYENAVDDMPVASTSFIVQSRLPTWADSFSRQGQSVRLMYMVQKILREKFDTSPDLMISRIEHLDNLIVSTLGSLLRDCHGKATQYCGPISCCMRYNMIIRNPQTRLTRTVLLTLFMSINCSLQFIVLRKRRVIHKLPSAPSSPLRQ